MKSRRESTSRPIRRRSFWPMPPTTRQATEAPSPENSAIMYLALKRAGIPTELHIFATGDHDFGVRQNEKLPSSWPQLCVKWLRSQGLLKPGSGEVINRESHWDVVERVTGETQWIGISSRRSMRDSRRGISPARSLHSSGWRRQEYRQIGIGCRLRHGRECPLPGIPRT